MAVFASCTVFGFELERWNHLAGLERKLPSPDGDPERGKLDWERGVGGTSGLNEVAREGTDHFFIERKPCASAGVKRVKKE